MSRKPEKMWFVYHTQLGLIAHGGFTRADAIHQWESYPGEWEKRNRAYRVIPCTVTPIPRKAKRKVRK